LFIFDALINQMKTRLILSIVPIFLLSCEKSAELNKDEKYVEGFTLEWSDEFNGDTINSSNWMYEIGRGVEYGLPVGWGNDELQTYTDAPENSYVYKDENGNSMLAIVALEDSDLDFTSAKMTTNDLQSFLYGRIEARVKVPTGQGIWPAFWMLGESHQEVGWPGSGEMDIFEVIGNEPNIIHSSAHWVDTDQDYGTSSEFIDTGVNLGDDFHVYRMDWTAEELVFTIDDREVNRISITSHMKEFMRPAYLIFNIAVGGNWPGSPDDSTVFPKMLLVDWVRVYSNNSYEAPEIPPLDIDAETLGLIYDEFVVHAINENQEQFPEIGMKIYGAGGEPEVSVSNESVMGDTSIQLDYPGGNWGGAFFQFDSTVDMSSYANSDLVFSIKKPSEISDFEIKLESGDGNGKCYLINYSGAPVANGFEEYRIPLEDFVSQELNLSNLMIPFSIWNPMNSEGAHQSGTILLDKIYFD
jgi:beta-glucanase (GH16 family)